MKVSSTSLNRRLGAQPLQPLGAVVGVAADEDLVEQHLLAEVGGASAEEVPDHGCRPVEEVGDRRAHLLPSGLRRLADVDESVQGRGHGVRVLGGRLEALPVALDRAPHLVLGLGARQQQRHPALRSELERGVADAHQVDGRPRPLRGPWHHLDLRDRVVLAVVGEALAAPGALDQLERLDEPRPGLGRVETEGLLVEVVLADPGDAEVEPSP